jgi:hypothetical protein
LDQTSTSLIQTIASARVLRRTNSPWMQDVCELEIAAGLGQKP